MYAVITKKKRRLSISKSLNIGQCWNIIGPVLAKEIGAFNYTPIPSCFDTNAYKIGHIFVPTSTQVTCFRAVPILKILGPICDFVVKAKTDSKWLDTEFNSTRTSGDRTNLRIILECGKDNLGFTGQDYYFLNKADDMSIPGNVTINRAAHEELSHVKWIGLITNVVETKIFEINIVKGLRARTLYIGDNAHTILFKYEICTIDKDGTVINSEMKKIHCKWLPISSEELDKLPLPEFQSVISTT